MNKRIFILCYLMIIIFSLTFLTSLFMYYHYSFGGN